MPILFRLFALSRVQLSQIAISAQDGDALSDEDASSTFSSADVDAALFFLVLLKSRMQLC